LSAALNAYRRTLQDLAQEQKKRASSKQKSKEEAEADCVQEKKEKTAQSFLAFLEKARNGEMLPAEEVVKCASYFQDELTLDNMPRMQLVNFCRYMSIPPYGSDNVLRFQLRHRMRILLEDDQRIVSIAATRVPICRAV
jgi:LETM1 and EF-hand domain-containing protein 1